MALGTAHRRESTLVTPAAVSEACARTGLPGNAIGYIAPTTLPSLWR